MMGLHHRRLLTLTLLAAIPVSTAEAVDPPDDELIRVRAQIIEVKVTRHHVRIELDKGSDDGLHEGLRGYVYDSTTKGAFRDGAFVLERVELDSSTASLPRRFAARLKHHRGVVVTGYLPNVALYPECSEAGPLPLADPCPPPAQTAGSGRPTP